MTEAVAGECASLADYIAEPAVRDPERAKEYAAPAAQAALNQRLEIFPALMHLIARARLDAPFTTAAAGEAAAAQAQADATTAASGKAPDAAGQ